MQDLYQEILNQLSSAWRFRWLAMALAWPVCLAGWWWVAVQPDVYKAEARVFIDTTSEIQRLLGDQVIEPDIDSQIRYVRQAMLGFHSLRTVAMELDLEFDDLDPEAYWSGMVQAMRDRAEIESFGGDRDRSDNVYVISFRHESRETAVAVVEALLDAFVDETVRARERGAEQARDFLSERVRQTAQRLEEAEQRLTDFQRRHFDRLPGMRGSYFQRLQREREMLEETEKQLELAQTRLQRVDEQLRGEAPRIVAPADGETVEAGGTTSARILELERRLDDLLLRFTEQHPDVQATRDIIERLRARQQLDLATAVGGGDGINAFANNPVYQQIRIRKNEIEAEVATLEADVTDRRQRVERLEGLIDEIPEIEAELSRLTRNYESLQSRHRALSSTLGREELTRDAHQVQAVDFRIIDPPESLPDPVEPNRFQLVSMVLIAGGMMGGGVAFLLSQLRPVFHVSSVLQATTGLPVIGAVGQSLSRGQRIRNGLSIAVYSLVGICLVAAFAAVFVLEVFGSGLQQFVASNVQPVFQPYI